MTSRGGICLRTVAASLAALPVMAPLKPPQAVGVRAASRSSCARQNLIRRYAAKTQHNSGVARTGGPVPHSSKTNAHSADVRFVPKADIALFQPITPSVQRHIQPKPLHGRCGYGRRAYGYGYGTSLLSPLCPPPTLAPASSCSPNAAPFDARHWPFLGTERLSQALGSS